MVTPAMSVTHVWTLLADVDVIQGPFILFSIVVLDPAKPCGTGPEDTAHTQVNNLDSHYTVDAVTSIHC